MNDTDQMRARVASGLSLGAALLLVTWYGSLPFLLVIMAGVVLALHEFYTLAARGAVRPLQVSGLCRRGVAPGGVGLSWPASMARRPGSGHLSGHPGCAAARRWHVQPRAVSSPIGRSPWPAWPTLCRPRRR